MPKYRVSVPYVCYVNVTLEADDREDAIEKAIPYSTISQYAGNDGCDKLIGVCDSTGVKKSIEANDMPLEGPCNFEIEVEECSSAGDA